MVSHLHEALVAMFRNRPALAAELLAGPLGRPVPAHAPAHLGSAEVVELRPAVHRADAVVLLGDPIGPELAVIVEVQLRRDEDKAWVWPEYLCAVRRQVRCPTVLLVVCTDRVTARWAAAPISLDGAGSRVVPSVLGPEVIPVLTDPVAAGAVPELAVLSALTHVGDEGPFEVLDALAGALDRAPVEHAVEYARVVLAALPALARRYLEDLMATETFEYESEFTRALEARGQIRGEARGRAAMVLRILTARGLPIPAHVRERITTCTDLDQLEAWGEKAITARDAGDLFA